MFPVGKVASPKFIHFYIFSSYTFAVTSRAPRPGGDVNAAAANDGDEPASLGEGHQSEHPRNEASPSDALPRNDPQPQDQSAHPPDTLQLQDELPRASAYQDGSPRPTDSAPTMGDSATVDAIGPVVPTVNTPHHASPSDDRGDANQQRGAPSSNSVPPRENDGRRFSAALAFFEYLFPSFAANRFVERPRASRWCLSLRRLQRLRSATW